MKTFLILPILFQLVSCGFSVELPEVGISTTTNSVDSQSIEGTSVASAIIQNECRVKKYKILNDHNGYFSITETGNIYLEVEKPKAGSYTIPIEVKCDSRSKIVNININIEKYIIPTTPFSSQIGSTASGILSPGNTSGRDGCEFGLIIDDVGSSYCAGHTQSSISDVNAGGYDAMIVKRDNTGQVEWVFQMGMSTIAAFGGSASGDERCHEIHVDENGGVYCYGTTTSALLEPNAGASEDLIVFKLSPSGSLEWLKHIGATTSALFGGDSLGPEHCRHAEFKNNAFYCAGDTESSLGEPTGGNKDIFFIKTLMDGTISWIKQIGSSTAASLGGSASAQDRCDGFGVDDAGSAYCSGLTYSSITDTTAGGNDILAVKVDTNGNLVWLTQIGITTAAANSINASGYETCSFDFDISGNLICGGLSSGSFSEAGAGDHDILLVKFNSLNGQIIWHKQMGASTLGAFGGDGAGRESCAKIKVDQSNNIYCSGTTTGSLGEPVAGNEDLYVAKFDSLANPLWLKHFGATTISLFGGDASRKESLRDFILDDEGNSYLTGATWGNLGEVSGSFGLEDAYIAKLDSSGNITWINQMGSASSAIIGANSSGREECMYVRLDSSKNIYCSGNTLGSLFEPSGGNLDLFLWKLSPDGVVR